MTEKRMCDYMKAFELTLEAIATSKGFDIDNYKPYIDFVGFNVECELTHNITEKTYTYSLKEYERIMSHLLKL